jgi:hypothetical protein
MSAEASPEKKAPPATGRQVRTLPVVAVSLVLVTAAVVVLLGRFSAPARPAGPLVRHVDEPTPVRDVDHYVPGSPPAVAERFLRAYMRARYEEARELATGELRARVERMLAEVQSFNAEQMEEYRRTRVFVDATNYDLEHVQVHDLPPGPTGQARKEVRGQAHAFGAYAGTRMDSRRGQTFVLELVDGAWRVAERTWERVGTERGNEGADSGP